MKEGRRRLLLLLREFLGVLGSLGLGLLLLGGFSPLFGVRLALLSSGLRFRGLLLCVLRLLLGSLLGGLGLLLVGEGDRGGLVRRC